MALFPDVIDLELTSRCNLDCVMCVRVAQKNRLGDMSTALLDRVLSESLAVAGRTFRLHGIGEPLLAPTFRDAVKRISRDSRGHHIALITNGHRLDRETSRFLLGQGIQQITVSLGAATAATYQQVRNSPAFERVVKNVIGLIDARDRMGAPTHIEVQLVRVPPADREVEAFVAFWSRFDVGIQVWHNFNDGRAALGEAPSLDFPPCPHLWSYTGICWDGRVTICCVDAFRMHIVGNANLQSLAEIYNGPLQESLRKLHVEHRTDLMPLCIHCTFRDDRHVALSGHPFRGRPCA